MGNNLNYQTVNTESRRLDSPPTAYYVCSSCGDTFQNVRDLKGDKTKLRCQSCVQRDKDLKCTTFVCNTCGGIIEVMVSETANVPARATCKECQQILQRSLATGTSEGMNTKDNVISTINKGNGGTESTKH